MQTQTLPFAPVQGTEKNINGYKRTPGYIYFATDTGKIFLDTDRERVSLGGGGAQILYASQKEIQKDLIDFSYLLYQENLLEKTIVPKKNDLIINSDGRFFKVLSFTKGTGLIKCSLIAVSGTGGGGSSTGPDVSGPHVTLKCTGSSPDAQIYIYGKSQEIVFTATATDDATVTYTYTITSVDTGKSVSFTETDFSGEKHAFDLGSKLFKGANTLVVSAAGKNSGSDTKEYANINSILLNLQKGNFSALTPFSTDFGFYFVPIGKDLNKTLKVYLNGNQANYKDLGGNVSGSEEHISVPKKPHGVYDLMAKLVYSTGVDEVSPDPLEYEIAFVDEDNTSPLIWFDQYPKTIKEHDPLNLYFMVYDPSAISNPTVRRYVNGVELPTLDENLGYNNTKWHRWPISNYRVGKNTFSLQCGTTTREITINVEKDSDRNLNIYSGDLYLNLNTLDRSNRENRSDREKWEYTHADGTVTKVKFNNFNWYNNGWIQDPEIDNSVLRISNGASIEIPLSVMNTKALYKSLTFELRFKLRNVQKYENLISISSSSSTDASGEEIVKVTKQVSSTEGVWCKYYNKNIGMCLGTQEGFFSGSTAIASGRYKEDQIVTVSFVVEAIDENRAYPLIYMYIDGVLSSIIEYDKVNERFDSYAEKIIINSDYCDVDLLNVRVYKKALSSELIVQNYLADQKDINLYDMNQIVDVNEGIPFIDYNFMIEYNNKHPDELLQPYAVLECVDTTEDKLPYIKDGVKNVNVTFVNPSLDRAYKNKELTDEEYLCGAPSFYAENIEFDVQGTSSQGYPRRNYKGKFKKKNNNSWKYTAGPLQGQEIDETHSLNNRDYKGYYMDNTYSETTFTWKADYMESSMTHNTGFASFVNTLYDHHPLQDYDSDIDVTNRRTTIYGFPMIVFQKTAQKDPITGQPIYNFIGRYNFNLDKGCNNVIGFKEKSAHPYVESKTFADVAECWELKHNQGGRVAFTKANFAETDSLGELTVLKDFEVRYHADKDGIENASKGKEDFEIMTQEARNEFLLNKYNNLEKVVEWLASTNVATATNNTITPVTYNEYNYIMAEGVTEDNFETQDYYIFENNQYKKANSFNATKEDYIIKGLSPDTYEPGVYYVYDETQGTYHLSNSDYDGNQKYYEKATVDVVYYTRHLIYYNIDNAEYRIAKFRNEFTKHFNMHYCAVYFVMTEFLIQYDSRGKNMMLASWGPQEINGDYIWYPIFYDIDTQLGVNNSGVPSWEYYDEPTKQGDFSTSSSVLWNNFYTCFYNTIQDTYVQLRAGNLTYEKLNGYYAYDSKQITYKGFDNQNHNSYAMKGHRPVNIINIDQYYKYIAPTFKGYLNTKGTISFDEGRRFYCLQGDRKLHRELFLRNRFNFMDSVFLGGAYSATGIKQEFQIRCNANKYVKDGIYNTSDKYLHRQPSADELLNDFEENPNHPLNSDWTWNITPYLRQYASLRFDEILQGEPIEYLGDGNPIEILPNEDKIFEVENTSNLTQQLFYIGGAQYISSLGDISLKYPDEIYLTELIRLKDIRLGNDTEGYYNNALTTFKLGASAIGSSGGVNVNAKSLLESMVLTGVTSLNTALDIGGSEKLKEFRALRTNIKGVTFADGVQAEIIHLPDTITFFELIEPTALNKIIEAPQIIKVDENTGYNVYAPGLYIQGVTDHEKASETLIDSYKIVGGQLGYDSYKLLKNLVDIKISMQSNPDLDTDKYSKELSISLKDVNWTPYTLVPHGEEFKNNKTYKKLTENSTLTNYTPDNNWNTYTLNQLIYEVDTVKETEKSTITDLSLLDLFLDENNNLQSLEKNYFKDTLTRPTPTISYPEITGNMYVNNDIEIPEYLIRNYYKVKYPNLNILVNKVTAAYTVKMVEVDPSTGQEIVLETLKYEKTDDSTVKVRYQDITAKPSRLHHDFIGWSLDGTTVLTESDINNLVFSSQNSVYTLYAVFDWTSYTAFFYNENTLVGQTEPVVYEDPFYEISLIPTRELDESYLEAEERIAFCGWCAEEPPKIIYEASERAEVDKLIVNVSDFTATNNKNFYAVFIKENVYDKATDNKYFIFTRVNNSNFYNISCNPNYELSGKITLPATYVNDTGNECIISEVGSFTSALKASHIFFMDQSATGMKAQYKVVKEHAFDAQEVDNVKLSEIHLPDTIETIESHAFHYLVTLKQASRTPGHLSDNLIAIHQNAFSCPPMTPGILNLVELPPKLKFVGLQAFFNAGPNITLSSLPDNLKTIDPFAFNNLPNIKIESFGSNDLNKGLTYIGGQAFSHSGTSVSAVYFRPSLRADNAIGKSAFDNYGKNLTVYVYDNKESFEWLNNLDGNNNYIVGFPSTTIIDTWTDS